MALSRIEPKKMLFWKSTPTQVEPDPWMRVDFGREAVEISHCTNFTNFQRSRIAPGSCRRCPFVDSHRFRWHWPWPEALEVVLYGSLARLKSS